MAFGIANTDNTDAPNSDYPYGKVRDRNGAVGGTPANTKTLGDFHQFFARLLSIAGIIPNGLPDNNYSGFQYFQALLNVAGDLNISYISSGLTFPGGHAVAGANLGYRKTVRNTVKMQGVLTSTSVSGSYGIPILNLPSGFRPSIDRWKVIAITQVAGSNFGATMKIETNGDITFQPTDSGITLVGIQSFYLDIEIDL